ncbi:MAG: aminotransferase class I/II-fold pyridoxal phosphate-dependent enzyme [Eubacterium sp.]|nr:aminotransferase class I/II-fold pyridoxal phosphate-dependent enzyme [Eubacterium sp.]MDE6155700.1 aminotransferase class I/II-fold pyridoxal phosphate-dependent enzyme [Eubacterium sp.]
MKLSNKLENLNSYPFHMPGHKRNSEFNIIGSVIDITEIDGFDNLHYPSNIINELEKDIAKLFHYERSLISVNGSTCGILSAICAVCNKGDKIIIARNCHKSVYNACFLMELEVIYIEPKFNELLGVYAEIEQESVDTIIKENQDAKAIVITSPTYEGITSNINCRIPLIIDSAHGAHFGFAEWLPFRANGDIVIQSLHKTLPCLTQTAVIHINNQKYFNRVKMYMDIFETSSPSYILLNSVDRCIDFLKNSECAFKNYKNLLDDFYRKASALDNITIHQNDDITRIIISAKGYSGTELSEHLRKYGIESEGATLNFVILISTVADTRTGFDLLHKALINLEVRKDSISFIKKLAIPQKKCKLSEIAKTKETQLSESIGKICGEYVFAYPPDIPIIVPGELITQAVIDNITLCIKNNINIISDSNLLPNSILTKTEL